MKNSAIFQQKFSIGFNGVRGFFEKAVEPNRSFIRSVYSPPPAEFAIPNARAVNHASPQEFIEFRDNLKHANIEFNFVLNFHSVPVFDQAMVQQLRLAADLVSPDVITVSNTGILSAFLEKDGYPINISVEHDIDSISQLEMLFEMDQWGQIESYNIGRRKTFDLKFIQEVRRRFPQLKLKLLLNEGCIYGCPDIIFHTCSSETQIPDCSKLFYCGKLDSKQHWRFLSGQYVPPKFLRRYIDLVDELKVSSRGISIAMLNSIMDDYTTEANISINRAMHTSQGGALFVSHLDNPESDYQLPYPEDFFDVRLKCGHLCHQCNYCRDILAATET